MACLLVMASHGALEAGALSQSDEARSIHQLQTGTTSQREAAAQQLGQAPSEAGIEALVAAMEDVLARDAAFAALGGIGGPAADALLEATASANPMMRMAVVQLLGQIKSRKALPRLEELLQDKEPLVRQAVHIAIGRIEGRSSSAILARLLDEDRDYFVKHRALRRDAQGRCIEQKNVMQDVGVLRKAYYKTTSSDSYYRGWREHERFDHVRAETFLPEHWLHTHLQGPGWTIIVAMLVETRGGKYGSRPDNLNRDCVKRFIELTHEQYRKHVGQWFGGVIPGIFTDEPVAGGRLPWTEELEQVLKQEHGRTLESILPHLALTLDDQSRICRRAYWTAVHQLYERNFLDPLRQWCDENQLHLAGHFLCEEEPDTQLLVGVNVYAAERMLSIPGFDHITPNIADRSHPSLNFGGKLVSSVAHQRGIKPVSCEAFACTPWNFQGDGMLRTTHWLHALGITWLIPHGFFYSIDGDRKFDAGKSFFFQDPAYPQFASFAAYAGRLGARLAQATHESDVCVVMPTGAFHELLPAERPAANALTDQIYQMVNLLLEHQIEFDIADDAAVLSAPCRDGRIVCGEESYRMVLVPLISEVDESYSRQFDGLRDEGVECLFGMPSIEQLKAARPVMTEIRVRPTSGPAACRHDLMCLRKRTDASRLLLIFNNSSHPAACECPADEMHPYAYRYDPAKDHYLRIEKHEGTLAVTLPGYGAILIEQMQQPVQDAGVYVPPDPDGDAALPWIDQAQWDYLPPLPLVAAIHQWDIEVDSEGHDQPVRETRGFCLARDVLGTDGRHHLRQMTIPVFDKAVINSRLYPAVMTFQARFFAPDAAACVLVHEGDTFQGEALLQINGREVDLASGVRRHVYDPCNHVCDLPGHVRAGENIITLTWDKAGEFDGLKSSIYLMRKVDLPTISEVSG